MREDEVQHAIRWEIEEHLAKAFYMSQEDARLMKMQIGLDRKERDGAVFDAMQ